MSKILGEGKFPQHGKSGNQNIDLVGIDQGELGENIVTIALREPIEESVHQNQQDWEIKVHYLIQQILQSGIENYKNYMVGNGQESALHQREFFQELKKLREQMHKKVELILQTLDFVAETYGNEDINEDYQLEAIAHIMDPFGEVAFHTLLRNQDMQAEKRMHVKRFRQRQNAKKRKRSS